MAKERIPIQCHNEKCKYKWNTGSKAFFVTCPKCQRKTRSDGVKQDEK